MGSLVGTRLGHFRIERLLGTGGMGAVYAATDERLERDVAVKVILDELDSPATRKRFLREARLAAKLTHPNIATVFEVGETDASLYIVMELLEGHSLRRRMAGRRLSVDQALVIARDLARALARAHAAGIAHRDIKPENVFITQPSPGATLAKVLDFGLARQKVSLPKLGGGELTAATTTGTGEITGTPGYWSPEQAAGGSVDVRTDIFSFGLVLYEMLTGRKAFTGDNPVALVVAVARAEPEPIRKFVPNVAADIEALLITCLQKKAEDRFPDATVLCTEIERVMRMHDRRSLQEAALEDATTADAGGPPVQVDDASTVAQPSPFAQPVPPPLPQRRPAPSLAPSSVPSMPSAPAIAPPADAMLAMQASDPQGDQPHPFATMNAPTPSPTVTDMRELVAAMHGNRTLLAAIAAGVGTAVLIVIVLLVVTSKKSDDTSSISAAGPLPETTASVSAPLPSTSPGAMVVTSSDEATPSFEVPSGSGTPTPVVGRPPPAGTGGGVAPTQPSSRSRKKPADCAQPFTVDSKGVKIPKLHCL